MFIDDQCTFNNNEFENNSYIIYPDELELKKENEDPCKALFLDLTMEVQDKKSTTVLFDKRDTFPLYMKYIYIYIYIYIYVYKGNGRLMHLTKHTAFPRKYIAEYKSWDKSTKAKTMLTIIH